MPRDGDLGILVVLGLGGLGAAAYLLLRPRSTSAAISRRDETSGARKFLAVDGERVLIFGDSLSHPGSDTGPTIIDINGDPGSAASSAPGAVLGARLLAGTDTGGQRAKAVRLNARVGRSAHSFLFREDGASLIARDKAWKPTKVIVMLGTNDIDRGIGATALGQTKDALGQIRDMYRAMDAEVVAIGPPAYRNAKYTKSAPAMLAAMREVFGADRVLDAQPLTSSATRSSDGVHFTQAGAALAGKQIAQALTASSRESGFGGGGGGRGRGAGSSW